MVDEGHQQSEAEETAGSEDEEEHSVVAANEVDSEEAACTKGFADDAQKGEGPGEAEADEEAVEEGMPDVVFGCKSLSTTQHDAVDHNQGNEKAQRGVEVGEEALHYHLDDGDEGGDDHNEAGDAHLVGHHALEQRDDHVRAHQHEGGGQAHTESVDGRSGGGQGGAHTEHEDPGGVLFDKSVFDYVFSFHCCSPFSIWNAL